MYGFTESTDMQLSGNPLRCDCAALWLRLRINGMTELEQSLNDWLCASPSQHSGKLLKSLTTNEVCGDPDYEEPPCEVYGSTSTTTATTTMHSTLTPIEMSIAVEATGATADTVTVQWTVAGNAELIEHFVVEWTVEADNSGGGSTGAHRDARAHKIEDLDGGTMYVVCVIIYPLVLNARSCTNQQTEPANAETEEKRSILYIILSCVLAVVLAAVLAGVIICIVVMVRRTRKRYPAVHKSTTSINSSVPFVTDHSKRFSKPKPYTISRDFNSTASLDLDRNLEGFTAEERDRILKLFRSNMSLNSVGTQRYVGDPTGAQGGAYANEIPVQDEYEEIPVDQYQYIDMDEINPNLSQSQSSPAAPPLRQSRPYSYNSRQSRPESLV